MAHRPKPDDMDRLPTEALLRKFHARDLLSAEEEEILRGCVSDVRFHRAGSVIVEEDRPASASSLLFEGFTCRYKDLDDGRRQIMEVNVPGDFVDLHTFMIGSLEHNVGALTDVRMANVPHTALRDITERHPHLARMLWFMTLIDAAVLREHLLSVGRRDALGRIAQLLCELNLRLEVVGMAQNGSFALPLTQADLADATGLTAVHVNRTLRTLRDRGIVTFRSGRVTIDDWSALQAAAEFDPGYLYLGRRPI